MAESISGASVLGRSIVVVRFLYLWMRNRGIKRFLARARQTRQVQRAVLLEKLRRNADSDFGREHGFAQIRTIADFRRHLPITNYEYHRPYVERVKKGDLGEMFGPGTN